MPAIFLACYFLAFFSTFVRGLATAAFDPARVAVQLALMIAIPPIVMSMKVAKKNFKSGIAPK